jgi:hypothetical protein
MGKLTYMSTSLKIAELEKAKKLIRFEPEMEGFEVEKRRLLLVPSIHRWALQEPSKKPAMEYHARVYAYLKDFVIGEQIDDYYNVKQICSFDDDMWSLKILFDPQCRIFGAFAGPNPDCFIGLHRAERKNLNFKKHTAKAIDEWNKLFPGIRRLRGTRFVHYISNNGVERDPRKSYS